MKEIDITELKKIYLKMLIDFDDLCHQNNIKYYLGYGTLLGAVRHKGFIPWDDDIDIIMLEEEYDKLLKVMKNNKKYTLFDPETANGYYYPFAKFSDNSTILREKNFKQIDGLGINMDIFQLYDLPNDDELRTKKFKKLLKKSKMYNRNEKAIKYYYSTSKSRSLLKGIICLPEHIKYKLFYRKRNLKLEIIEELKNYKNYNKTDAKYVGNLIDGQIDLDIKEKSLFAEQIKMIFENHEFDVPLKYKEFLTKEYGDYMKLPPKKERVANHGFTIYKK